MIGTLEAHQRHNLIAFLNWEASGSSEALIELAANDHHLLCFGFIALGSLQRCSAFVTSSCASADSVDAVCHLSLWTSLRRRHLA